MTWSCHACTFLNCREDAKYCEICETKRPKVSSKQQQQSFDNSTHPQVQLREDKHDEAVALDRDGHRGGRDDQKNRTKPSHADQTPAGPTCALLHASSTSTTTTKSTSTMRTAKTVVQQTLFGKPAAVTSTSSRTFSNATGPTMTNKRKLGTMAADSSRNKASSLYTKKTVSSSSATETTHATFTYGASAVPLVTAVHTDQDGGRTIPPGSGPVQNHHHHQPPLPPPPPPSLPLQPLVSFATLKERAAFYLRETFGLSKLRNLQPAAIKCALKRQSQIVVMATGGGKSLCYQLPALALGGTTIVVSPLIALMVDQVQALVHKRVAAALLSSTQTEGQNRNVLDRLVGKEPYSTTKDRKRQAKTTTTTGPITILYCTPEQIQSNRFQTILHQLHANQRLSMVAIDEAHCMSSWGHDFRPAYRQLGWLRQSFPTVPCLACTATATPQVLDDIRTILQLQQAPCHVGSFDRPNIYYTVAYKDVLDQQRPDGAFQHLIQFITNLHQTAERQSEPCSGIVYVHKRDDTTDLAERITTQTGYRAVAYHGGLHKTDRAATQQAWMSGAAKIAIATVAFGMGVDLSHVRYVVHWSMAKSVAGFYQESGRAGRDGRPSQSLLFYSKKDSNLFAFLAQQQQQNRSKAKSTDPVNNKNKSSERAVEALEEMVNFCLSPGCRRAFFTKTLRRPEKCFCHHQML